MTKKTRVLSLILTGILLSSLMVAFSATAVAAGEVKPEFTGKLTVLMYDLVVEDGINPTTLREQKGYGPYLQEFRDMYPNIELDFQHTDSGAIFTKAAAMTASGELDVGFNIANDQAMDLTPYIERDRDQLQDVAVTGGFLFTDWDNYTMAAMPLKAKVFNMYYDKQIFDDWGVEYLSPKPTWDEISEKAAKMTGKNPRTGLQNYGFWSALGGDPQDIFTQYMSRVSDNHLPLDITGDRLVDLKYNFTTNKEWKDAVDWYKNMIPYMDPGCFEYVGYDRFGSQENNIAIMQISWTDGIIKQAEAGGTTRVEGQENRIGFTDMPRNPDGLFTMYFGGTIGLSIPKASQNKDAAWEFLKWACTSVQWGEYLYESVGFIPVNYTTLEKTGFKETYPDIAEVMENQPKEYLNAVAPAEGAYPLVDKYTVLYWQDAMSYEDAMQAMQDELQAIIDALQ